MEKQTKKDTSWGSYPKVEAIGKMGTKYLLNEPVIVEEKVDGSQFSFGIFKGQIKCKSKRLAVSEDTEGSNFGLAVATVKSLKDKLKDGWTYRCEFLRSRKHNILTYDRVPKGNIIIYDVNTANQKYLGWQEKAEECERLGLEHVPLIYQGMVTSADFLRNLLERESILGGVNIEGIVIKNYARMGRDNKVLMAKLVGEKFREVQQKDNSKRKLSADEFIKEMVGQYKSPARWDKAIQHLSDDEVLKHGPEDIGPLIKEICTDLLEECGEEIKTEVFKWIWKKVAKEATSGFAEYYKNRLLESQFDE